MSIRLKILLSYHYYKDTDLDALLEKKFAPHYPEIFLDSGGFSAMTQGVTINLSEYAAFLKRYAHRITTYANLDVIGDAAKTWANQQKMEALGLRPLPVFHTGESFDVLERYVERYPYIAIGGMVPYLRQWKKLIPWLVQCFKRAEGKSVFHGFGATAWGVIHSLKWYSVDSSSWAASFRFGQVGLFDEHKGKWQETNLGNVATCKEARPLFERYGFDWLDFADRKRNDRKKICAISALAYMKAEAWLRRRHGEIAIPKRDAEPRGTRVYLAEGGGSDTPLASAGLNGPRLYLANRDADHFKRANDGLNDDGGARIYLADANPNRLALPQAGILQGPRDRLADPAAQGNAKDTVSASTLLNASQS